VGSTPTEDSAERKDNMGLNITCDRCGKEITASDILNIQLRNIRGDDYDKVLLNQSIYLCKEHREELSKLLHRFIKTYMENRKK
jgi:hypothetical protein